MNQPPEGVDHVGVVGGLLAADDSCASQHGGLLFAASRAGIVLVHQHKADDRVGFDFLEGEPLFAPLTFGLGAGERFNLRRGFVQEVGDPIWFTVLDRLPVWNLTSDLGPFPQPIYEVFFTHLGLRLIYLTRVGFEPTVAVLPSRFPEIRRGPPLLVSNLSSTHP